MELIKKVKETIGKYSMLSDGDRVLIGLSGGPDSVCLAVILDKLRKEFNLSLFAVYVDHMLRPDEVEDEKRFCSAFCAEHNITFFSEQVDVREYTEKEKLGKQEAARELRYRVFDDIANREGLSKIALGHNADDQVETFFINLLRGSGRKGLTGIPPVRSVEHRAKSAGSGMRSRILIIRPLIETERSEIESFLLQKKGDSQIATTDPSLPFMTDSSNLKQDYFRNRLRLTLIPELKKKNPSLVNSMCRTMDILREEDEYLEFLVNKTLIRLISRKSSDTIELFLSPLAAIETPLLRRVLRRALGETEGLRGISFVHIEDIIGIIRSGGSGDRLYLPGGIRVIREYSILKMTSSIPAKITGYEIDPPCEVVIRESGSLLMAEYKDDLSESGDGRTAAVFDADLLKFPLKVRARNDGDFFCPAGFGKRKKLQDFFVDEKVPRDERDIVPIILSGEDIIWVAGYRMDERFRATEGTKRFLLLKSIRKHPHKI